MTLAAQKAAQQQYLNNMADQHSSSSNRSMRDRGPAVQQAVIPLDAEEDDEMMDDDSDY